MTVRDPGVQYKRWTQVIPLVMEQVLRRVHTAIPGIVVTFDPTTRRAEVQPAVNLMLDDGSGVPRAQLLDVPVLRTGGGGWRIDAPLAPGDAVLLLYCERDISGFKESNRQGNLPTDQIMADSDVVALPMFTPTVGATAPEVTDGLSIQSADGATAITLQDGRITLKADRIVLAYDGGQVDYP